MRPLLLVLVLIALTFAAGCGKDNSSTDNSSPGKNDRPLTPTAALKCENQTCNATNQYCLLSKVNGGTAVDVCQPLPENCTTCDCAQKDALLQFPHTNDCSDGAAVGCDLEQNKDEPNKITVTCSRGF